MFTLNPDAMVHAEGCAGTPVITQDGIGQWSAECSMRERCPTGWEVSGCESRAEAGAAFYGHDPREEPPAPAVRKNAMRHYGVAWWGHNPEHGKCACCQRAGRTHLGYNGGQSVGVRFCVPCTGPGHEMCGQ